jgi:dihydroorotate dehydrogenase electron transfer subunit
MTKAHRNTIFLEDAEILSHQAYAAQQFIMRVQAPQCAMHALAGSFAHIQCDPQLPMRRPISIMRASKQSGWVDFLYKIEGEGTRLLSTRKVGEQISILAPIGKPFEVSPNDSKPLLIGGGVGIPPMIFLAEQLKQSSTDVQPLVLMGSEIPFPFKPTPSQIMLDGIDPDVIAAMPLLDDWNIPSRLASLQGYAGCYQGYVTELAAQWLETMTAKERQAVKIFACGPHPMLKAVAKLASDYELPCQVSLEEYMACAVGGCAGCVVRVQTEDGPAMKRVCVDGPVFDSRSVF